MSSLLARGERALWVGEEPSAPPHLRRATERALRAPHLLAPEQGDWWLRARLLTSTELNASEWGLLKVIAKRASVLSDEELERARGALEAAGQALSACPPLPVAEVERFEPLGGEPLSFSSTQEAGRWLLARAEQENERLSAEGRGQESPLLSDGEGERRWRGHARVVAACLLDEQPSAEGVRVWALAFKQPQRHPAYHAEWALLDALLRATPTPPPLTLLSTLKPCKLCAGAWASYGPLSLTALYVSDDPGKMGQHTAFDEGAHAWRQASSERAGWRVAQGRLSL